MSILMLRVIIITGYDRCKKGEKEWRYSQTEKGGGRGVEEAQKLFQIYGTSSQSELLKCGERLGSSSTEPCFEMIMLLRAGQKKMRFEIFEALLGLTKCRNRS